MMLIFISVIGGTASGWEVNGVCWYDCMCLVVDVAVLRRMLCHGALVRRPVSLLTSEVIAGVRAAKYA